jgi:pyrroline-5-carboxylate reductase
LAAIAEGLSDQGDVAIVRVMPNMPALINEGASGLYPNDRARPLLAGVRDIFDCIGKAVLVDSEALIDAVTAISGSGPAYYFLMMEKMIETAVSLGLSEETAQTLVIQTAKGAALLASHVAQKNETPGDLARRVATKGGTTDAALTEFAAGGFGELVDRALRKAHHRSQTLSD